MTQLLTLRRVALGAALASAGRGATPATRGDIELPTSGTLGR
jgi:hypothetical protein